MTNGHNFAIHPDYAQLKDFVLSLPSLFAEGKGEVMFKRRNEIRLFNHSGYKLVVKSYGKPSLPNRIIYDTLRASKAKRSFIYAEKFISLGVSSPQPVAWYDTRHGLLLQHSYYVSLLSPCNHDCGELFEPEFKDLQEQVMREVGRATAILHNNGYAHKDYGRGNILFSAEPGEPTRIDIVDLNRMYIGKVGLERGCKNLERLPMTPAMRQAFTQEYARLRGFGYNECYELIEHYRNLSKGQEEY